MSAPSALEGTVLNVLIPLIGIYGCATMRAVILDLQTVQQTGWGVSIFLRAFLLCLLIFRKNVRFFPFFTAYLTINIGKAVALNFAYKAWGFESLSTYKAAWIMEGIVACVKALAVAELCRLLLGGYRGIWSLAWRVLLTCAGLILLYSAFAAKRDWEGAIIGAGRASELTIAAVLVIVFLFMRHYEVVSETSVRFLALGFCIYACIAVINLTILERYTAYSSGWNQLSVWAYLASLFAWTWALRSSIPRAIFHPMLFSRAVYQQLSPEINARLRALNDQLIAFWELEAPRS